MISVPIKAARTTAPTRAAAIGLTQTRLVLLMLALSALPLLWPAVPPLTDLPNHMSRYKIGLDIAHSPYLHRWFEFRWALVGNLGVDLLVTALAPLIGLEPATKLVVMMTPVIAIGGVALIAREVHGAVPRTAAFAAVFAYNFPFSFGFVNFTLGAALALLAFGFWIRLGRLGRRTLRAALFVPIGCTVWLAHAAGWGILGLLAFTWTAADARAKGVAWHRAIGGAILACLPLALPLAPMLLWSASIPQGSLGLLNYDPARKLAVFFLSLRQGVPIVDALSMLAMWGVATVALIRPDLGYDKRLAACGLVLVTAYALMPVDLMGSGHADLRIAPYAMMVVLIALKPVAVTPYTRRLGHVAIAFFAGQMAWHTIHYARIAAAQEHSLAALPHLPVGSTVFSFASVGCSAEMEGSRMDHVHRLAIVRREAFTNGNWPWPAVQTLKVKPAMVAGYVDESSQLLDPRQCRQAPRNMIHGMLRQLPRDRYRYLWLLDTPRRMWPTRAWLRPVWHNDRSILYAVAPPGPAKGWRGADRIPARMLPLE